MYRIFSVVQTAEGALNEVHSILQRMRDLAVQASNTGSQDANATAAAQTEITQLKAEIDRGVLGDVYHARSWMLRRAAAPIRPGFIMKEHSSGGPCIDIGVHILDLTLWMMGHPQPVSVSGVTTDRLSRMPGAFSIWGGEIPDTMDQGYHSVRRELLIRAGYRALLAVPLLREGHLLGGLLVNRKTPGAFAPEVIELLKTFGTQSAMAIQNARLFREIEDKSRQLQLASEHKSQFVSSMSHELRTPLNAVIGYSEMLQEEANQKGDEDPIEDLLATFGEAIEAHAHAGRDAGARRIVLARPHDRALAVEGEDGLGHISYPDRARLRISRKNGAPMTAVTTPTGISPISRAAMSA